MAMRLSGLISGMDTDSVIQQLVAAKSTKVDKTKKAQTKLEWKTDAWKELNKKLKSFQSKHLNNMRFSSAYSQKTTKVSNSNAVSVLTGSKAMNGVQSLEIDELAKTAYLTGGKISAKDAAGNNVDVNAMTTMEALGVVDDSRISAALNVKKNDGSVTTINLERTTTISDVLNQLKDAGLNASFDENNKRFFISAKESGKASDFEITAANGPGDRALEALGLATSGSKLKGAAITKTDGNIADKETTMAELGINSATAFIASDSASSLYGHIVSIDPTDKISDVLEKLKQAGINAEFDEATGSFSATGGSKIKLYQDAALGSADALEKLGLSADRVSVEEYNKGSEQYAAKIDGQDAVIRLNGATFTSNTNVFEINGLTFTALEKTTSPITVTTEVDTSGIYDMVKSFIKDYSELVNEMDKLYNADSAKGYEPLTDDEKEAMSDREIEEWEKKVKESLLRRDGNLYSVNSALQTIMAEGVKVNGKTMYLSDFGINTLGYFAAEENERHAYHIDGNKDDEDSANNEDKLQQMIANDPEAVQSFFSQLTQKLYTKMNDLSSSVEGYRSFGSFYDDKKMKTDYKEYTSKISTLEKKLTDYEDKWYAKFAAMEKAMAKLQESTSAITSLLGGS